MTYLICSTIVNYRKWLPFFTLLFFIGSIEPNRAIAASLEDVSFNPLDEDRFEVVLELDESDFAAPQVFSIEQPARLVIDLPGVENKVAQKKFQLTLANTDDAILLGTNDRTRLVLNLDSPANYETVVSGSSVRLVVGSGLGLGQTAASNSTFANTNSGSTDVDAEIIDLEFRRGTGGEGNIVFELSTDKLNTDVSLNGNKIEIRFFDAALDEALQRVFDVTDFATPVTSFSAETIGNESLITIDTNDRFDYLAYQTDTSYVISVKPFNTVSLNDEPEFAFTGERLSLNFQNIEVRAVLQLIADFTDLNLVASDTVSGSITLRLENVPWDQALEIVLKAKGLDQRREGNVLLVAPIAEIAERERLEVEANRQLQELAPIVTENIRIRYADAEALFSLLSEGAASSSDDDSGRLALLSERGTAIVDPRTNTIILSDTEDKVKGFLEVVEELDIPIRQVLIEARIVAANSDFRRELGFRWGGLGVNSINGGDGVFQVGGTQGAVEGGAIDFFNGTAEALSDELATDALAVDLGVPAATSSLALSFLTDSSFIDLELSALENEGYGEIVSQPKVIAGDQQTAAIRSGQEIAFLEASASGAAATSFREAVLELEVTPQITPDNRIILNLLVTQNSVDATLIVGGEPAINVTELETQVLVDNGQTLVLGGIFELESENIVNKVPVLGDIPILGRAFKNTVRAESKTETLIFITPKILTDPVSSR